MEEGVKEGAAGVGVGAEGVEFLELVNDEQKMRSAGRFGGRRVGGFGWRVSVEDVGDHVAQDHSTLGEGLAQFIDFNQEIGATQRWLC